MHKIIGNLALVVAVSAGTVALGTMPAHADTPTYFSIKEFQHVKRGMTAARVEQIADIPGLLVSQGDGYMTRNYKGWVNAKGNRMTVAISYHWGTDKHWHLEWKTAYDSTAYGTD